ncbi:hypothetical protein Poli38472_011766 [Pythium oligandrum]|uniref:PIPK domain-containing protein n=1 Tax=Pythium oligandrum TaxID=41045 RepID=A0A8K1C8J5_PYTOL|nr:hypothetical protein Poli38472_011766 [Pythium oligandrum]|eukprot:TMW58178.1 hypothetical protein Poli38472_011766 [Pythium oligandrum]
MELAIPSSPHGEQPPLHNQAPPSSESSAAAKPTQFALKLDHSNQREGGTKSDSRLPRAASPTRNATPPSPLDASPIKEVLSDPDSPAYAALLKAAVQEKADPSSLLDKRPRIGHTKLGRTKYKAVNRSFNRPVGNEIHDQHEQYALTYGMMCGILNSAGLQNPFKQRLTMDDFMRVDKRVFPPNSKLQHPFKFKDYSPDIFRQIRRRFCIDSADYMVTLCGDFNYIEFLSNSKSGQFFFYSHDGRFMIKTQTKEESKFLRRILPHYYKFVMENPNTLITRFYGMHRVKMHYLRRKMHFIIMASVFDSPLEVHARFDLKGSTVGRHATPKDRQNHGVLKDMDLVDSGFRLEMSAERRAMLLMQLRKDVEFLKRMKIMDYSLLIGVHDSHAKLQHTIYGEGKLKTLGQSKSLPSSPVGGTDGEHNVECSALSDTDIIPVRLGRSVSVPEGNRVVQDASIDAAFESASEYSEYSESSMSESGELAVPPMDSYGSSSTATILTPTSIPSMVSSLTALEPISPRVLDVAQYPAHGESVFCRDEGGIYGRDASGKKNGYVYFLGVIDILQQYNTRKIAETFFKGFRHNRKQISAVNPTYYGDRFIEFMEKHVVQDHTLSGGTHPTHAAGHGATTTHDSTTNLHQL